MIRGYRHVTAGLAVLLLTASGAWADTPPPPDQVDVGIFTAVEGKAVVTHPGVPKSIPIKLQEGVLFKDVIETDKESRTKALLNDDSILTVGEHSRVEVTEHIYDPGKGVRSVVVNLVKGQVRALVGKIFSGSGSKFEIHTPTAVAAARGTYFVVFHINGASGIINVGTHGNVDFSSGGHTVNVPPGQFSITPPGGGPPSPPNVTTGGSAPSQVTNAVHGTEVKDTPKEESPKQMAMASGGTAPVSSPSSLTPPGVSGSGGGTTSSSSSDSGDSSSSSSSSSSSNPTASTTVTTSTTPTTVVSVPAVTSGAASPPPPPPPAEPPPLPPPPDGGGGGGDSPPPPKTFTELTDTYIEKVKNSTETFNKLSEQTLSLDEHATNLVRQVLNASETYVTETEKLSSPELLTQAQTTTTTETTKVVTLVETFGFKVVTLNPLVIESPPRVGLFEWFVNKIAKLITQFKESVDKANRLEQKLIVKAESDYERRIQTAEEEEAKKIQQAQDKYDREIAKAEEEYRKALERIEEGKGKGQSDAEKALEKLNADRARAAAQQDAALRRAAAIESALKAKAALIQQARIVRAQAFELAKVNRSGDKLIGVPEKERPGRIGQVSEEYLAKLSKEGVSQTVLTQAELDIKRALAIAEAQVKLAQQAAIADDIIRRTTRIGEEHDYVRRFGKFQNEHENFNRRHRLARQADEHENFQRRHRFGDQEREFVHKKR